MLQQRSGHAVERRAIAHRIVAAPTVHVHVDESRRDQRIVARRLVLKIDADDPPVIDVDPAARVAIVQDQPSGDDARCSRGYRIASTGIPSCTSTVPGSSASTSNCTCRAYRSAG